MYVFWNPQWCYGDVHVFHVSLQISPPGKGTALLILPWEHLWRNPYAMKMMLQLTIYVFKILCVEVSKGLDAWPQCTLSLDSNWPISSINTLLWHMDRNAFDFSDQPEGIFKKKKYNKEPLFMKRGVMGLWCYSYMFRPVMGLWCYSYFFFFRSVITAVAA